MATQTRYASSVVSATLYANGANAYSLDDSYATWTSTKRNDTGQLVLGIAAFDIPTGATINSVTLHMQRKWGSGDSARIDYSYLQIALSATLQGTRYSESLFPTTDTDVSTDGGTWTVANLNSGNMRAYIDSDRINTPTSTTHSIDAVWVVVDYTGTPITLAGVSRTATRSAAALSTGITLSGRSATTTRSAAIIDASTHYLLISQTATRSAAALVSNIDVSGISRTSTRSIAALTSKIDVSGISRTSTRSIAALTSKIDISGISRTNTRSIAALTSKIDVSGISRTTTRSSASISTLVGLVAVSRTATRATADVTITVLGTIEVFFQYRKVGDTEWIETTKQEVTETTEFLYNLYSLDPNTWYEFRAVSEQEGAETLYGEVEEFKTNQIPPLITFASASTYTISGITNMNVCEVTFTADQALVEWEARADGTGVGTGLIVGYGTILALESEGYFEVWYNELTQGDKTYRINIYGKNADGEWTEYVT